MRILVIGAHQDDCEFRTGGVTAKWVQMGHTVQYLSVANGCGGHHTLSPEETTATRARESAEVAKVLGVGFDVWDIDDCNVVADLPTRKRMIRYIRAFNPDLVITHRTNDYHADHRATAQLVQDATYLLVVPHECPDVPAMRFMPEVWYNEDFFKNPVFRPDIVLDITDVIDQKMEAISKNVSQVYQWLPYTRDEKVPEDEAGREAWLKGADITVDTTDEEVMAAGRGYLVKYAKVAARFRRELIERYGEERGSKVRFAEAFEISEYGKVMSEEKKRELLDF